MDLKNLESLKEKEEKLQLRQKPSKTLNEAENLKLNLNDEEEATRSKKVKQENFNANEREEQKQGPELMNFDAASTEGFNLAVAMATTKVLRNPMLLTKILKRMEDMSDVLQNCRLVNLEWRDLSTDVLLLSENLYVSLSRQSKKAPYQQQQRFFLAWGKDLELSQLTHLIPPHTRYRFPCVNFSFQGDLNCADAQEFLNTHGKNIKRLILSGKSDLEFIRKILVEQARNVQSLRLESFEVHGNGILFPQPNPIPINLPFLTCFKIDGSQGCSGSLVQEIVPVAPKLEKCLGIWQIEQIQLFLPRIHLFQEVSFSPRPTEAEDGNHLAFWESPTFQNMQPQILYVDYAELDFQNPAYGIDQEMILKIDGISSKLLEANQKTLKQLHFCHSQEFEHRIQWPKMVAVEELVIRRRTLPWPEDENEDADEDEDEQKGENALKCPTLEISQHFPNLQLLSFSSIDIEKSGQIFNGELLFLESLSIKEQPELFNHCHNTFPNITHLSLSDLKDGAFPRIAPKIWTMKILMILHLDLNGSSCSVEELDAVFTGMEKNTCEFLRTLKRKK